MNTMDTIHWTEDESLLDAFVLGRMPEQQRAACEQHRATCGQCRDAVERHQRLVTGIKSAGRMNAKRRLAADVQALRFRRDRQRLLFRAAAAVVVAVAGFSVYRVWIAGHQGSVLPSVELRDSVQFTPPSVESRGGAHPTPSKMESKKTDQLADETAAKHERRGQRMSATDKSLPAQPGMAKASEAAGLAAAEPEPGQVVVTAERPVRSGESRNRMDADFAPKKGKEVPVTVGLEVVAEGRAGLMWISGSDVNLSPAHQQFAKKALTIEEKSAPAEKRAKEGDRTPRGPVVVQQLLSQQSIVSEQQAQQSTGDVRALAELRGDSLILSLDVAPPAAAEEIATWHSYMAGPDSVVVILRERVIGFRLPPELVHARMIRK